jgi:hypothetical protein
MIDSLLLFSTMTADVILTCVIGAHLPIEYLRKCIPSCLCGMAKGSNQSVLKIGTIYSDSSTGRQTICHCILNSISF